MSHARLNDAVGQGIRHEIIIPGLCEIIIFMAISFSMVLSILWFMIQDPRETH